MSMYLECNYLTLSASTAYSRGCRCKRCLEYFTDVTLPKRKERVEKNKQFINTIKLCCSDCSWNVIPELLEFHHENNNNDDSSLASLIHGGSSLERLLTELDKGVFLCPTCHSMRHFNRTTKKVETFNKDLR
jgi:hypothetical protein